MMVSWLRDVVCVPRVQTLCNYKLWTAEGAISERGTVLRLGVTPAAVAGGSADNLVALLGDNFSGCEIQNVMQILSHYEVKAT